MTAFMSHINYRFYIYLQLTSVDDWKIEEAKWEQINCVAIMTILQET
jgi:hypothetical protein